MPKFRNKSYIVIDTRYNVGGSDEYSRLLIQKLYGKEYLWSLGKAFIWNRQWQALYVLSEPRLMEMKMSGSFKSYMLQKKRYKQGGKFYLEKWHVTSYKRTNEKIKNPVTAKIILLTNGLCASMCYMINRTWLQLPNVTLIGQSPNTMGLITIPVPFKISQYVSLYLASSIFTNMGDEFNEKLMPSYVYSGEIRDINKIQAFVNDFLKNKS